MTTTPSAEYEHTQAIAEEEGISLLTKILQFIETDENIRELFEATLDGNRDVIESAVSSRVLHVTSGVAAVFGMAKIIEQSPKVTGAVRQIASEVIDDLRQLRILSANKQNWILMDNQLEQIRNRLLKSCSDLLGLVNFSIAANHELTQMAEALQTKCPRQIGVAVRGALLTSIGRDALRQTSKQTRMIASMAASSSQLEEGMDEMERLQKLLPYEELILEAFHPAPSPTRGAI